MEPWARRLIAGDPEAAWDLFIERYRRLIFAAIRHYTTDHDEVMDLFAQACQVLRADRLARLRRFLEQPTHSARFSTWLVTVVRNLTVDWFRHRDGRPRLKAVAADLSPLRREIFAHVFAEGHSHLETYELLHSAGHPDLSFREFLAELRATYQTVASGRRGLMAEFAAPLPWFEEDPVEDDPAVRSDRAAALAKAIETLPPEERVAVRLYVVEDLPADEVARILGWPNGKAVYNRVYRALAALRDHLTRAGVQAGEL